MFDALGGSRMEFIILIAFGLLLIDLRSVAGQGLLSDHQLFHSYRSCFDPE